MEITLRKLTLDDYDAFIKANKIDFEEDFVFAHYWEQYSELGFEKYLEKLSNNRAGIQLNDGHVPSTLLFAFNDESEIVGRSSIRHHLDDHLKKVAGHIGYGVLPVFRRQGVASKILADSIVYYKEHIKIDDKILVTCDDNNIGSIKTIEKNNGNMWDKISLKTTQPLKRRYWINLNER